MDILPQVDLSFPNRPISKLVSWLLVIGRVVTGDFVEKLIIITDW